jgi:hypothetical protein
MHAERKSRSESGPSIVSGSRLLFLMAGAVGIAMLAAATIDAHKGITSKYTYNDDVYPILRDKCGRCHVDGGPAPMSLLKYDVDSGGAAAWAESIREMLVSESMPPWYADPTGPAVKNSHTLTPRELDTIVTWATGGAPQGDMNHKPAAGPLHVDWTLGKPDVTIQMDKPFTLGPSVMQDSTDVTLPTNFTDAKWAKAIDLLPGTPSMVRRATISVDGGPILAVWEPGDDATPAPGGTAFKIPAGAKLRLQIYYKKPYLEEQLAKSDRSTIGLYLTDEPLSGKDIQTFAVDGPSGEAEATESRTFTGTLTAAGRVLAVRPQVDLPYASMDVTAVAASGRRVPLLKLRAVRPEWPRRYWLADPVELPAGTKIEVKVTPGDPDSGPLMAAVKSPLQVALDFVPQ